MSGSSIVTGRITRIKSEHEFDRDAAAEEAANDERELDVYDVRNAKDRALSINGALNSFDFVSLTGQEYWKVYGHEPARTVFFAWALKAQAAINDIVAEHDRLFGGQSEGASR